ncbi:MAG: thiamine pyrophosphate-binding protein, partial [Candidatus Omnitrophica bacterium]|nr:thiamine pyrophosphate-binding protein [Candidatus Omnitrophota bacterium]
KQVSGYREKYPTPKIFLKNDIDPNVFMHKLSAYIANDAFICVDVGQHQMWAAQSLRLQKKQRFLSQGGMGAMGSALAMAIGSSFSHAGARAVVIAGDGGFQLNIQELETIFHHRLAVKIILINNVCYGMVRQFQEQYFNSRYQSTVIGYSSPSFLRVASAYKIAAKSVSISSKVTQALDWLFANNGPALLEVKIPAKIKVLPKLSVNRPIEDQEPLLSDSEMKENMLIKMIPRQDKHGR